MSRRTIIAACPALPARRLRAGAATLLLGVALFGLGQIVHGPEVSPTRSLAEYVTAMSTTRLAVAHLLLAGAVALLVFGSTALYGLLAPTRAEPTALAAFCATTAGAALVALGLGAAALAYPDVAAAHSQAPEVLTPVLERGTRVLAVVLAGAALLVAGGLLAALAVWRSALLPRWRGVPYALAVPLVLATENAPVWAKAAVAAAITAAAWWLAEAVWRQAGGAQARPAPALEPLPQP